MFNSSVCSVSILFVNVIVCKGNSLSICGKKKKDVKFIN